MNTLNRPLRIAVADDDPRLREFFERALTLLGYEVVVLAADGEELVSGCLDSQPDLIITDFHMPHLNGAEAVDRIWRTMQVPAILLSGLPDADVLAKHQPLHSLFYMMKPVPLIELRQAIARAAARSARAHATATAAEQECSAMSR